MGASLLFAWGLLCGLQDARSKRISNWLTLGMLPLAVLVLWYSGSSLTTASPGAAIIAMLLGVIFSFPGYLTGRMGAADVKLLAALGLASSPMHVLLTVAITALAMMLWALVGPKIWRRWSARLRRQLNQLDPANKRTQPYAPFVFIGLASSLVII